MSEKYIFKFFNSYEKTYTMFNCKVIEHLFKFNNDNKDLNKSYFYFKFKAKEKSLVQFNLTNEFFNSNGKIEFDYYHPKITIFNYNYNNSLNKCNYKFKKNSEYIIEWYYEKDEIETEKEIAPQEILFWVPFEGEIQLDFLGIKENRGDLSYNTIELIPLIQFYKLTEKLGEYYHRKSKIYDFIKNKLHINIISDQEEKGFNVRYEEYGNLGFTFITNTNNINNILYLSQNLEYPNYVFKGTVYHNYRINGNGSIFALNSNTDQPIYNGNINFNLFPQFVDENNNNN